MSLCRLFLTRTEIGALGRALAEPDDHAEAKGLLNIYGERGHLNADEAKRAWILAYRYTAQPPDNGAAELIIEKGRAFAASAAQQMGIGPKGVGPPRYTNKPPWSLI